MKLVAASLVAALSFSCSVDLGDMPARCTISPGTQSCPDGYSCIHNVCAKPGTPIPITLTTLQYLRSTDLRIVPQSDSALVVWQIYRYDIELHDFAAARITPDGNASAAMTLVSQYPANANYLEPYFDVLSPSEGELLMTMGAAPADDAPEPRLTQFAVHLPPLGQEAKGSKSDELWELRMRTIGYGAVSEPRLARTPQGIALSYFESLTTATDTVGDLAVFQLGTDGSRKSPPACADSSCCQANDCKTTRAGTSVAVSVTDAFVRDTNTWWVVDDKRPSFVRETAGTPTTFADGVLPRLAVPVDATADTLLLLQPSARAGNGLPDDPVQGPASLWSVTLDAAKNPQAPKKVGDLPGIRDTPRPVWLKREGKPSLLVTPGTDIAAPEILVYSVDASNAHATQVAAIKRYSTIPIAVVQAATINGKLYVTWLDASPDIATVRAEVIPEP